MGKNSNDRTSLLNLYPYQNQGAVWLSNKKYALLADSMGVGKSAQAIRACDFIRAKKVLVLCPASVVENWRREFEKFKIAPEMKATVISYDHYLKYFDDFKLFKWDVIILDEAHYLKEPTAKRTKAVFGMDGAIRTAPRVWCLSGTPAPNNASELWVMLYTFGFTTLTYEKFIDKFCHSYQVKNFRRQISGTKTNKIPELRELMSGFILRRTKEEVLPDLPPIYFNYLFIDAHEVQFPAELKAKLNHERKILEAELTDIELMPPENDFELIARLEGLAQSIATLRRYTGIQKAQACSMLIEQELNDGAYEKIVIFAIHKDVIDILKKQFPGAAVITGETPQGKRQKEIDRFQNSPSCKVFIGNIQAAGTGITLTAASNVLFVESSFVPSDMSQAAMRCHRIGQVNSVYVRTVCVPNSIDEKICRIVEKKTKEIAKLIDPNAQ